MNITIPEGYGYVVMVLPLCYIVLFTLSTFVSFARKQYNVPYPTMYAGSEIKEGKLFNQVQRGHQHALESLAITMFMMLVGGIRHPYISAIGGTIWCLSRLGYAIGYRESPKGRFKYGGSLHYLGTFAVLGCTISLGIRLLGLIDY